MPEYIVTISNVFEANNFMDAVDQMAVYVTEEGMSAGYRVQSWPESEDGLSEFVDAEYLHDVHRSLRTNEGIDLWEATDKQVRRNWRKLF